MKLLSKITSRKGIHMFEWIAVFLAITLGTVGMVKLTKGYWNARMKSNDVNIKESFYDRFPKGQLEPTGGGGCNCTDWALINACGVGDCGRCQKIVFRGCSPLQCDDTQHCFTPGQPVPDCPECENAKICLGVQHSLGCWSDQPTSEQIDLFGNNLPCAWGQMIVEAVDCSDGSVDGVSKIECQPNAACEFQCQNISTQFIGLWYILCPSSPDPQNPNTNATFVLSGECSGKPCEYQCPKGFDINSNNLNNTIYSNGIPESNICECPNDGGNPHPYTVVVDPATGKLTCKCLITTYACTGIGSDCDDLDEDGCNFMADSGAGCTGWISNPNDPSSGHCKGGYDCSNVVDPTADTCKVKCTYHEVTVEDPDESECNVPILPPTPGDCVGTVSCGIPPDCGGCCHVVNIPGGSCVGDECKPNTNCSQFNDNQNGCIGAGGCCNWIPEVPPDPPNGSCHRKGCWLGGNDDQICMGPCCAFSGNNCQSHANCAGLPMTECNAQPCCFFQ